MARVVHERHARGKQPPAQPFDAIALTLSLARAALEVAHAGQCPGRHRGGYDPFAFDITRQPVFDTGLYYESNTSAGLYEEGGMLASDTATQARQAASDAAHATYNAIASWF